MDKKKVLFICVHNSARSQMAEAFLKQMAPDVFEVESAGLQPGKLNPVVVEVMKEAGIPVCPSDADSEIKQVSSYISDKRGGEGCVRDVIEQVLRLHDNWMDSDAFTW